MMIAGMMKMASDISVMYSFAHATPECPVLNSVSVRSKTISGQKNFDEMPLHRLVTSRGGEIDSSDLDP